MKFRPVNERIVIKRVESDERTPGGIIIPDNAQEKPQIGEVLAIPEEDGTFEIEVGDRVLFGKWSGVEVKIEDQDVLILKQEDILGIF